MLWTTLLGAEGKTLMWSILRSFGAIILGLIVGNVLLLVLESMNYLAFLPRGLDWGNQEAVEEAIANMPTLAWISLLISGFIGPFCAAYIAARVAGQKPLVHGVIIGCFFLVGSILNMQRHKHPAWYWVPGLAEFPLAAFLGACLAYSYSTEATPTPVQDPPPA